jgi:hypothetical protein
VILAQIPFVVIDVALVLVAVFAVIPHITPVVIDVALIVIAIHAVIPGVYSLAASVWPTVHVAQQLSC